MCTAFNSGNSHGVDHTLLQNLVSASVRRLQLNMWYLSQWLPHLIHTHSGPGSWKDLAWHSLWWNPCTESLVIICLIIKHRDNFTLPYLKYSWYIQAYRFICKSWVIDLLGFPGINVLFVAVYETKLGCNSTGWNDIRFCCDGIPRECVEGSQHEVTVSPYVYKSLPFTCNRPSQQGSQVPMLLN
jgi:hypothetical protein